MRLSINEIIADTPLTQQYEMDSAEKSLAEKSLSILNFTASLNILKQIVQQKSDRERQNANLALEVHDDYCSLLPETWQAKLLTVETELKAEQLKRKAVEEDCMVLQAKITSELEPVIEKLQMEVDRLSQEKNQLTMDLKNTRESHAKSMKELEMTIEKITIERDEINESLHRKEKDIELLKQQQMHLAADSEKKQELHENKIKFLNKRIKEMTDSRDSVQSLLEQERQANAMRAKEDATTTQAEDLQQPIYTNEVVIQTLVDHLKQVVDSALDAIDGYESVSQDPQMSLVYKEAFDNVVSQAMQAIQSIVAPVVVASTATQEDRQANVLRAKEDATTTQANDLQQPDNTNEVVIPTLIDHLQQVVDSTFYAIDIYERVWNDSRTALAYKVPFENVVFQAMQFIESINAPTVASTATPEEMSEGVRDDKAVTIVQEPGSIADAPAVPNEDGPRVGEDVDYGGEEVDCVGEAVDCEDRLESEVAIQATAINEDEASSSTAEKMDSNTARKREVGVEHTNDYEIDPEATTPKDTEVDALTAADPETLKRRLEADDEETEVSNNKKTKN